MASITLRDVRKSYQAQEVLHGISLDIQDGEFVALVGPSGCGKSTLLRMLAGLEDITGGHIQLCDRLINEVPPQERNIAMVFQNYALYPHMSVAENLGFALRLHQTPPTVIAQRVQEIAGILGLESLLQRLPAQLSGGQRQRVAMGRAIIRQPQAFLFDEPLSNLDAQLRVQMRAEIKALHQRLGTTTVYVTHDQIEAMTMADRIVVLRDGRVEQVGTPLELYDRPANAFVAQFIGSPSMNLIHARVQEHRHSARTDDGLELDLPPTLALSSGQEVVLGIRPEHVQVHPEANHAATLYARTLVIEPTGTDTQVVAQLGPHRITSLARKRLAVRAGMPLHVHLPTQHLHVFDAQSGARLQ